MHVAIEKRIMMLYLSGIAPVFHLVRSAVRIKQLVLKMICWQYFSPKFFLSEECAKIEEEGCLDSDNDEFIWCEGIFQSENSLNSFYEKHEVKKIDGIKSLLKDVLNVAITPLFVIAFEAVSIFGLIVPDIAIKTNIDLERFYYSYNNLMVDFII